MQFFTENTTLIIPTRNRPIQIVSLLKQINLFKVKFFEILVIDSSDLANKKFLKEEGRKFEISIYDSHPSTSFQRNFGLRKKNKKTEFVMFLDDDIVLFNNSIYEMHKVIKKYKNNSYISGFGFNQIQNFQEENLFEKVKTSNFFNYFGLYSSKPGKLLKSGWHTKILNVKRDIYVDWIYTTACVYKSKSILNFKFDENFSQYGYLEDLDFSLNLRRINKKIIIAHLAKFQHPVNIDRSSFSFGVMEVINRYKIVKKNNLNHYFFLIFVFLRFLISAIGIFKLRIDSFSRAIGNIYGTIICLIIKYKNL